MSGQHRQRIDLDVDSGLDFHGSGADYGRNVLFECVVTREYLRARIAIVESEDREILLQGLTSEKCSGKVVIDFQ